MTTIDRLAGIIQRELGRDPQKITAEAGITRIDAVVDDSLELLQMSMAIEDEFGVEISDEDLENLIGRGATIAGMVEFLETEKGVVDATRIKDEDGTGDGGGEAAGGDGAGDGAAGA